jgi:hypothetical protein
VKTVHVSSQSHRCRKSRHHISVLAYLTENNLFSSVFVHQCQMWNQMIATLKQTLTVMTSQHSFSVNLRVVLPQTPQMFRFHVTPITLEDFTGPMYKKMGHHVTALRKLFVTLVTQPRLHYLWVQLNANNKTQQSKMIGNETYFALLKTNKFAMATFPILLSSHTPLGPLFLSRSLQRLNKDNM